MVHLEVKQLTGTEAAPVVLPLYTGEGNGIDIRPNDLFFVGFIKGELAASVRFCVEEGAPMLRTMRVAKRFQGQGVGAQLLESFARYLDEHTIRGTFCLPYKHLEKFYGRIGFNVVPDSAAPEFLKARMKKNRDAGYEVICMRRD